MPVLNSAGLPLAPLEVMTACTTLTVTRFTNAFDIQTAAAYTFALNSDTFLGNRPGKVQVVSWTGERQFQNNRFFYEESIKLRFCPAWMRDWQPQVLDAGFSQLEKDRPERYVQGSGNPPPEQSEYPGKLNKIYSTEGTPVTEPWPLNGYGRTLSVPSILAGKVNYLTFDVYPMRPFAALKLTKKKSGG